MTHTWDEATNSCKHCGATPWAINEGYRPVDCNDGPTLTGFTHRLRVRMEERRLAVEKFTPPESS